MKKIVRYRKEYDSYIPLGQRAVIRPLDHPDYENVHNFGPVLTSYVEEYDPVSGRFETENTIYYPLPFYDE